MKPNFGQSLLGFLKKLYFQTTFPKKWLNKTLQITRRSYGTHAVNIHVYRKRYPNTLTTFFFIPPSFSRTHTTCLRAYVFAPKNGCSRTVRHTNALLGTIWRCVDIYDGFYVSLLGGTHIKRSMAWWRFFILYVTYRVVLLCNRLHTYLVCNDICFCFFLSLRLLTRRITIHTILSGSDC